MKKVFTEPVCVKCGHDTAYLRYYMDEGKEIIERKCCQCGFEWNEWPLDSQYVKEKEALRCPGCDTDLGISFDADKSVYVSYYAKGKGAEPSGTQESWRSVMEKLQISNNELIATNTRLAHDNAHLLSLKMRHKKEITDLIGKLAGLELENKGLQGLYNAAITCTGVVVSDKQYKDLLAKHDQHVETIRRLEAKLERMDGDNTCDRRKISEYKTLCDNQAIAIKQYQEHNDSLKRDLKSYSDRNLALIGKLTLKTDEVTRLEDLLLKWSSFCDTIRPILDEIDAKNKKVDAPK